MKLPKLEIAVVLIIFGVLAHILLDRLVAMEHDTERLEVSLTIRHINLGLKLAVGEHTMRGEEVKIPRLLSRNPLNFLGEQTRKVDADGTLHTAGHWWFDASARTLNYTPRQPEAFEGETRLAWQMLGHPDSLGRLADLHMERLK